MTIPDATKVMRGYSRCPDLYPPAVAHSELGSLGDCDDQFSMVLMNRCSSCKLALDADYAIHNRVPPY